MASFLLSIATNSDSLPPNIPAPPAYIVEWSALPATTDGLDLWTMDLQIAGNVADWAKSSAYGDFWAFLESALASHDPRPRGTLSIKSRTDARRIGATIQYMRSYQLERMRDELATRIAALVDPTTRRLKEDLEFSGREW